MVKSGMDINAPLTSDELRQLDHLMEVQGGMRLPKLHGYLTSIISGPELVHPDDWLPWVWEEREDVLQHPQFSVSMDYIRRLYNSISATLEKDQHVYPLLSYKETALANPLRKKSALVQWCQGYMEGVELTADSWFMIDHREAQVLLIPIILTSEKRNVIRNYLTPWLSKEALKDIWAISLERMSTLIFAIDAYWLAATRRPRYTIKAANSCLCPCGSGKDFEICCGRRTLH